MNALGRINSIKYLESVPRCFLCSQVYFLIKIDLTGKNCIIETYLLVISKNICEYKKLIKSVTIKNLIKASDFSNSKIEFQLTAIAKCLKYIAFASEIAKIIVKTQGIFISSK